MKLIEYAAAAVASLAFAISLLRHRLVRDWRAWLVPASLLVLAVAIYQGLVGPTRGLGRFVDTGWVRSVAALVCATTAFLIAVVLDRLIEEKERAHESARVREQWLRMLTGRLPAIVWTTNRKQTITSHVGGGHRRVGIRPNEYIGRTLEAYFGGAEAATPVRRAFAAALDGESLAFEMEWRGEPHEGFVEPLYDARARIAGTIGFLLNTADERYGSPSVPEADALLALAVEHLPLLMWATDATGRVVFASGSNWDVFGCEPSDLVGSTAAQAVATHGADDRGVDAHRRALAGQATQYRVSVGSRSIVCYVEPRRDPAGKVLGAVAVAFDEEGRSQ